MAQHSQRELETLARIYRDKEFMDYLESRVSKLGDDLIKSEDSVQMRILQGRARENLDLIKVIRAASESVRKA